LVLASERCEQRVLRPQRRGLRVLPQLRGLQPVGQQPLQRNGQVGPRRWRCPSQGLVHQDDGRSIRRSGRLGVSAARTLRDGTLPHDLPQWRKHLGDGGDQAARVRATRLHREPTHVDEAKIRQMGLANCPFTPATFDVKDGRKASLHNSAFGTVFGVADDKPLPCATTPASRRSALATAAALASN
jgi:hypothetical protein